MFIELFFVLLIPDMRYFVLIKFIAFNSFVFLRVGEYRLGNYELRSLVIIFNVIRTVIRSIFCRFVIFLAYGNCFVLCQKTVFTSKDVK